MGWQFRHYLSARGVDEIEAWEDALPASAQTRIGWVLDMLKAMPTLRRPYVGTRAHYPNHFEIVVSSSGREFRPLGCYGPAREQFTLLVGAEEKGGRLEPRQADEIADTRRPIVTADPKRSRPR